MRLRTKFHNILVKAIKKYISETDPVIKNSIIGFVMEHPEDDRIMAYNLQVAEAEDFPIWKCVGGDKIPKQGCGKIYTDMMLLKERSSGEPEYRDEPLRCSFCGNTEFKKYESLEEWRDAYGE